MPLSALHANHIGAVAGGFELQRANNALLYIPGLEGNDNNVLTLSIASFPLPKETTNPIEVNFLNEKRKFAGMTTFDDLTVVFNDYVDRDTAAMLYRWRYMVKDPTSGKIGNKRDYAKNGRMVKYGPDGSNEREYELWGIWPSGLDGGEIDFGTDDGIKVNLTLSVDKVIYKPATGAINIGSTAGSIFGAA